MPLSINGIGTQYFGECDFESDGSYVTTEWFSLFYLPILPRKSVRVIRLPKADAHYANYSTEGYLAIWSVPFHWGQVFRIYAFSVFVAGYFYAMVFAPKLFGASWRDVPDVLGVVIGTLLSALPFLLVWFARKRASRKVVFSEAALDATLSRLEGEAGV